MVAYNTKNRFSREINVSFFSAVNPLSQAETGSLTRVSAVVGGEAELPCDARPPQRNDSLLLVVWYRDDNPVYRYVIK